MIGEVKTLRNTADPLLLGLEVKILEEFGDVFCMVEFINPPKCYEPIIFVVTRCLT